MIFKIDKQLRTIAPVPYKSYQGKEKHLEDLVKSLIGCEIFPELLVFGNERSFQREADIFAVNERGDLVIIELKIEGHYDRGKVLQAMEYAQLFSRWQYVEMNAHFKKCYHSPKELNDVFEEHFGYCLDETRYNQNQRIIIISNSSDLNVVSAVEYWQRRNIDIKEYFYRMYEIPGGELLFELSAERSWGIEYQSCWVNTCVRHFPDAYLDMVLNRKASAYGGRADAIGEWMTKGFVFLFHNGYGIIGGGKGTRKIQTADRNGEKEKMIFLDDFIHGVDPTGSIKQWISSATLREITGRDFYFPNTLVGLSMDEGRRIYAAMKDLFKDG